ncbi:MAG: DUF1735 domain-containing protein [Capnocytophaga sp.]|nr:DUF1735 domain-containing protein [Capnocytophaga sp.]
MKYSIVFFAICAAFLYGCDKNDTAEGKAPGVLYLSENGVNKLTSYDVGETFEKEIWVGKGGLSSAAIPYRVEVAAQWLDSVNVANGTSFSLLPADSYELVAEAEAIGGISGEIKTVLRYDPDKILSHSGNQYDAETFMLPLQLTSTQAGVVNPAKRSVFYTFAVSDPILQIMDEGIVTVNLSGTDAIDLKTTLGVPFSNKWDITATIGHKQETIDAYNTTNNSFFALLPSTSYSGEDTAVLASGENSKEVVYTVNASQIAPGNYILPVQISAITSSLNGTVTDNIKFNAEKSKLFIFSKMGEKLSKTGWTITSVNSEEKTGEGTNNGQAKHMIDDNLNTFWHSRWQGGDDPLPFEIVVDMGAEHLVSQIEIIPRNNANNGITHLRFETSTDGTTWEYVGRFEFVYSAASLVYAVKASNCRYIKVIVPEDGAKSRVAAIREMNAYGR